MMNKITLYLALGVSVILTACGNTSTGGSTTADAGLATPLTANEIAGLKYMREEEELARDLYMNIYTARGSTLTIFQSISNNSEIGHAQKMLDLLNTYGETDPSTGNTMTYTDVGLQALYDQLIGTATGGATTDLNALMVGAKVEEVDIEDINAKKAQVQAAHALIIQTYDNLLCGSRNHLRSFVAQIETATGTTYTPQIPALAAEVTAILAGAQEKCGR
ncbi:MAG: DUF2202 domain-containing protein [Ghiorsea sp.]|nr:DUF2202 domain-containing protein [Ghiorsea sp.]